MSKGKAEEYFLATDRYHLVRAANFALTKALAKFKVFESEAGILEEELRLAAEEMKKKKVRGFISQQQRTNPLI